MNYSWNWGVLLQAPYAGWLATGLCLTIAIAVSAACLALIAGSAVGLLLTSARILPRFVGTTYVGIFRNVPLILQLFILFFVVPEVLPTSWGHWIKRDLPYPELFTSIVALGLFTSARVAVQVNSGIRAVPPGQRLAGAASGMTRTQIYRYILVPQAARIILPPLTSELLTIFKNSSVALTIGVYELTAQTQQIESFTYQGFEAFTAATVLYALIALVVTLVMRRAETKAALPGASMGEASR